MASTEDRESSFCDKDQNDAILRALYEQKQTATFCDIIMKVCGKEIYAHSNLLAASSPYFDNFLRQDVPRQFSQRNPQVIEIQIDGTEPNAMYEEAVSSVIDFIYTGKMSVSDSNVSQILEIARIMQMESVVRFCEEFSQGFVAAGGYVLQRGKMDDDIFMKKEAVSTMEIGINTDIIGGVTTLASWNEFLAQKPFPTVMGGSRQRIKPHDLAFAAKVKAKQLVSISLQVYPYMLERPDKNDQPDMHDQATFTDSRYFDALHTISLKSKKGGRKKQVICKEVEARIDILDPVFNMNETCGTDENIAEDIQQSEDNQHPEHLTELEESNSALTLAAPDESTTSEMILDDKEKGLNAVEKDQSSVKADVKQLKRKLPKIEKPITRSQRTGVKRSSALELLHGSSKRKKCITSQVKANIKPEPIKESNNQRDHASQEQNVSSAVEDSEPHQDISLEVPANDEEQNISGEEQDIRSIENMTNDSNLDEENLPAECLGHGEMSGDVFIEPIPKTRTTRRGNTKTIISDRKSNVGPGKYQCDSCFFITNKVREMTAHIKLHKVENSICFYCEQKFEKKDELLQHMDRHKGPDPFFCCVCDIRFKSRTLLNMHIPKHSDNKPYICEVCCMGFKWKHALKCHMLTHSNKKEHLCDLCGYATNHKSQLKAHRKIHTGDTLKCLIKGCTFQATKAQNLKYHMLTHTREKPHQCDICGQNFSLVKNLRRHLLLHATENKIQCGMCGFNSTRPDKLKEHLLKVHGYGTPPERRVRVSDLVIQHQGKDKECSDTAHMIKAENMDGFPGAEVREDAVAAEGVSLLDAAARTIEAAAAAGEGEGTLVKIDASDNIQLQRQLQQHLLNQNAVIEVIQDGQPIHIFPHQSLVLASVPPSQQTEQPPPSEDAHHQGLVTGETHYAEVVHMAMAGGGQGASVLPAQQAIAVMMPEHEQEAHQAGAGDRQVVTMTTVDSAALVPVSVQDGAIIEGMVELDGARENVQYEMVIPGDQEAFVAQ